MGENEGPERQVSGFEGMKDNHILREYSWKPNSIENQFLERKTKDAPQDNNWNIEELLEITPNEKEADREGRVATERDPVVS